MFFLGKLLRSPGAAHSPLSAEEALRKVTGSKTRVKVSFGSVGWQGRCRPRGAYSLPSESWEENEEHMAHA